MIYFIYTLNTMKLLSNQQDYKLVAIRGSATSKNGTDNNEQHTVLIGIYGLIS